LAFLYHVILQTLKEARLREVSSGSVIEKPAIHNKLQTPKYTSI
jgi:hypothetical protein